MERPISEASQQCRAAFTRSGHSSEWLKWADKKAHKNKDTYPVFGEKVVSNVSFKPSQIYFRRKRAYENLCSALFPFWNTKIHKIKFMKHYLVFNRNLCPQNVIGVPLLCESQTILTPFVFGLQAPTNFTSVRVRWTRCWKFLTRQ